MVDCKGTQLKVGDKVRFFGTGAGSLHHATDPVKRMRAYGVIIWLYADVAHIRVRGGARVWQRSSSEILKRP